MLETNTELRYARGSISRTKLSRKREVEIEGLPLLRAQRSDMSAVLIRLSVCSRQRVMLRSEGTKVS